MTYSRFALLLLLSLPVAACGGLPGADAPAAEVLAPTDGSYRWPDLPLIPPTRSVAAPQPSEFDGIYAFDRSGNTAEVGTGLQLNSSPTEPAWALYEFNYELAFMAAVEVELAVSGASQVFIALADYAADRWEIRGPFAGTQVLDLDQARHRRADDSYFLVVVTAGGDSATVLKLRATIDSGWTIVSIDASLTPDTPVWGTGLVVDDGRPAVCYFDTASADLNFAASSDPLGLPADSWSITPVDESGDVGRYCDMELIAGQPAISYLDFSQQYLKYARLSEADNWLVASADEDSGCGYYSSLAMIAGKPAIAHYNVDTGNLKYCRASTTTGTGPGVFWTIATAHSSPDPLGLYASMLEVDGRPAIAHFKPGEGTGDLLYAICDNELGLVPTQWTHVTPQTGGLTGFMPCLFSYAGLVHISYQDVSDAELQVTSSSTPTGDSIGAWQPPLTIDNIGSPGRYSSFALIDGRPAFAYYDYADGDLRFAWAKTGELDGVYYEATVDSEDDAGKWCQLAEVDGHPAISYAQETVGEIRYAIYQVP